MHRITCNSVSVLLQFVECRSIDNSSQPYILLYTRKGTFLIPESTSNNDNRIYCLLLFMGEHVWHICIISCVTEAHSLTFSQTYTSIVLSINGCLGQDNTRIDCVLEACVQCIKITLFVYLLLLLCLN